MTKGPFPVAKPSVERGWSRPPTKLCFRHLEHYPTKWDQFDGGKSVFRAGAATNPGSRSAPPQAGCFLTVASLRSFADALHRHATRYASEAWRERALPPPKIIPVKWFHLVG
jgi:hypothetical protein